MKRYVIGLIVAAASSAAALSVVLIFLNPYTAKWLGVTLLLTSAFFLTASVFTLIGFTVRVLRSRKEVIYAHLATSFRQGLLLGVVVTGSLLLQVYRIFNIWSALLFVAAVVLVELAFQSHTSSMQLRESHAAGVLPEKEDTLDKDGKLRDITATTAPQPWKTRFPTKQNDQLESETKVRHPKAPPRPPAEEEQEIQQQGRSIGRAQAMSEEEARLRKQAVNIKKPRTIPVQQVEPEEPEDKDSRPTKSLG